MNEWNAPESNKVLKVFLEIIIAPYIAAFTWSLGGGLLEIQTASIS